MRAANALLCGLWLIGCHHPQADAPDGGGASDASVPLPLRRRDAPPDLAPLPPMMGGQLTPSGATFRVWAPNADAVTVSGDFDGWGTTHTLTKRRATSGSATSTARVAGQHYHYLVSQGGQTYTRSDPRARGLDDANGASVLLPTNAYAWQSAPFSSRRLRPPGDLRAAHRHLQRAPRRRARHVSAARSIGSTRSPRSA